MRLADKLRAESDFDKNDFLYRVEKNIRESGVSYWQVNGWFQVNHTNKLPFQHCEMAKDLLKEEGFKVRHLTHYNGEQELIITL